MPHLPPVGSVVYCCAVVRWAGSPDAGVVLPITFAGCTSRLEGLGIQLGLYSIPDPYSPWLHLNRVFFVRGVRGDEEVSVLLGIVFRYPPSREEGSREVASRRYAVLGHGLY